MELDDVRRQAIVDRLMAQRRLTLNRLATLREDFGGIVAASKDSNADDEHDPEGSTIAFERSQVGALARDAEHQLAEIEAALERVDVGSYGICERCGGVIAPERLDARPVARACVRC